MVVSRLPVYPKAIVLPFKSTTDVSRPVALKWLAVPSLKVRVKVQSPFWITTEESLAGARNVPEVPPLANQVVTPLAPSIKTPPVTGHNRSTLASVHPEPKGELASLTRLTEPV